MDRILVLNVLFTRALSTRIPTSAPLIVNTVNPAFCLTELRREVDQGQFKELDKTARTSEEGSRQLVFSAIGPEPTKLDDMETIKALRGAYVSNNDVLEPYVWVRSEEGARVQQKVWVSIPQYVFERTGLFVLMNELCRTRRGMYFAKSMLG